MANFFPQLIHHVHCTSAMYDQYFIVLSVTLELHSPTILFVINLRLQCTSQTIPMVCCCFSKILNYYLLRKSDVIKITCTHSMAMMMSDGQN